MDASRLPNGTIVVGVDGSPSAAGALRWGATAAQRTDRALTLVHAVPPVDAAWLTGEGPDHVVAVRELRDGGRLLLTEAREQAEKRVPGIVVHELLVAADPRSVLAGLSGGARLLVLGSRGRGSIRSRLLGSVGLEVLHGARCPVVIRRPHRPGAVRRGVLVGVDAGSRSRQTLEFAFEQAALWDLPLTVLHCRWQGLAGPTAQPPGELALAEALAGLPERHPDVHVTRVVEPAVPEQRLVELSPQMDLLVVGTGSGRSGAQVRIGSVAAGVVEHAECPVAVVPHHRG